MLVVLKIENEFYGVLGDLEISHQQHFRTWLPFTKNICSCHKASKLRFCNWVLWTLYYPWNYCEGQLWSYYFEWRCRLDYSENLIIIFNFQNICIQAVKQSGNKTTNYLAHLFFFNLITWSVGVYPDWIFFEILMKFALNLAKKIKLKDELDFIYISFPRSHKWLKEYKFV